LDGGSALLQGYYLHGTTQKKLGQTSTPEVGFKLMTPVFEKAKTYHALNLAATVISSKNVKLKIY
jgi:hypothetical protein